jgi:hypothetical protein
MGKRIVGTDMRISSACLHSQGAPQNSESNDQLNLEVTHWSKLQIETAQKCTHTFHCCQMFSIILDRVEGTHIPNTCNGHCPQRPGTVYMVTISSHKSINKSKSYGHSKTLQIMKSVYRLQTVFLGSDTNRLPSDTIFIVYSCFTIALHVSVYTTIIRCIYTFTCLPPVMFSPHTGQCLHYWGYKIVY